MNPDSSVRARSASRKTRPIAAVVATAMPGITAGSMASACRMGTVSAATMLPPRLHLRQQRCLHAGRYGGLRGRPLLHSRFSVRGRPLHRHKRGRLRVIQLRFWFKMREWAHLPPSGLGRLRRRKVLRAGAGLCQRRIGVSHERANRGSGCDAGATAEHRTAILRKCGSRDQGATRQWRLDQGWGCQAISFSAGRHTGLFRQRRPFGCAAAD